jgi:cytochrome c peroxidase
MQRSAGILVLLVGIVACTGQDDLRERMSAAGVFSPSRSDRPKRGLVELGQLLFFDRELSGNRNIACASCHLPLHHAGDLLALGRGQGATGLGEHREGGPVLPRNTVSPFNRSFAESLLWDGRVERLEDGTIRAPVPVPRGINTLLEAQALLPLLDRDEMRGVQGDSDVFGAPNELAAYPDESPEEIWNAIMARLMAIPEYQERFAEVFPDVPMGQHSIVHAVRAIARFEMHLWELTDTPFDQFLGSEHRTPVDHVLTETQRRGADLFFGDAGCDRCHNGPLLSDGAYHNIGVRHFGPGKRDGIDEGRFLVTGNPEDRFAFRTPPLRNVELSAPYMHNGTAPDLRSAIRQHLEIDPTLDDQIVATLDPDARPLRPLTEEELLFIEDFLRSLSSSTELTVFPGAGEPTAVPSSLPFDRTEP